MSARPRTNAWKQESTHVYYGIDRLTLEVIEVRLSRDRVLRAWFDDETPVEHPLGGRTPEHEIGLVLQLAAVKGAAVSATSALERIRSQVEQTAEVMRSDREKR